MDEMIISENGPALHDADYLHGQAMNSHWAENSENGKWHFIRESDQIISYFGEFRVVKQVRTMPVDEGAECQT